MRVGICIPIGERMPERRAFPFAAMRDLARLTDDSGLDSIWVADHLFFLNDDGEARGAWESMSILSALAEATTRVELGPLVLCGPFRNAGLMAWMANTIDEISGGRFVLGLGAGWSEDEFHAFDFQFDNKVSLFADQLEVIVPLLREGRVDYDGKWAKGSAELRPPGPRPKGPPIMIACSTAADDVAHRALGRSLEQRLVRAADRRVSRRARPCWSPRATPRAAIRARSR